MASNLLFNVFFIFICIIYVKSDSVEDAKSRGFVKVITLQRTKMEPIVIKRESENRLSMEIFCYEGVVSVLIERLKRVFSTGKLHIKAATDDYQLFIGANESAVYTAYLEVRELWIPWHSVMTWQSACISVKPFNRTCIGVATQHDYTVIFVRSLVDRWMLLMAVSGVILFFLAERLSRNVMFYYGAGVSVGIMASLLILIFIMSRFVPWRKGAYAFFMAGWAVISWAFMHMWTNMTDMVQSHYQYFLCYIGVAGLVSFAVCFYKGPVSDPRSLSLIKWTIQLIACVAVFLSMQVEEAAVAVILLMLTVQNFPMGILRFFQRTFRYRFPRKRSLLNQAEYELQADECTKQALGELREYCRSPNCDAWKTISRLGTPQRFAKWIEGSAHLTGDEYDLYDSDTHLPEVTDDEDEMDFRLNSL